MTYDKQADEIVDIFRVELHDSMDILKIKENKLSTKCAIKHVEGLIKETMRRSRIDELTIILGILEQRINQIK